jgi:proline iminopeptidase
MPRTLIAAMISIAFVSAANAATGGHQTIARTSGVMTIGGTPHPYHTEGSGVTCIVTGLAPFFPQQFSDRLKQHIRFVYVDFKNSWNAESPPNLEKITMDSLVDEIDQVRQALGLDKVCVVGHSATGFIAVEYALRHPARVSHSIQICVEPYFTQAFRTVHDAFWVNDASAERKAVKQRLDERLPNATLLSLTPRDSFAMRYVRNGPKYFYDASYDFAWLWIGRHFSAEVVNWYVNKIAADWDPRPRFAKNTVPTFVALGRYDYNVPYVTWDSVKKTMPHLTSHVFEKSGHFPMIEEAALFDDLLIRWLKASR